MVILRRVKHNPKYIQVLRVAILRHNEEFVLAFHAPVEDEEGNL